MFVICVGIVNQYMLWKANALPKQYLGEIRINEAVVIYDDDIVLGRRNWWIFGCGIFVIFIFVVLCG